MRHNKILPIQPPNFKKNAFPAKPIFFQDANSAMYFYQHAATRSHSQLLAATRSHSSGRKWLQVAAPSEWPQVAGSGCKWPLQASGRKWPLPASGRKWPQVAASGRSKRVAASGRKWPLPASGRKWPQVAQVAASGRSQRDHAFSPIDVDMDSRHLGSQNAGLSSSTLLNRSVLFCSAGACLSQVCSANASSHKHLCRKVRYRDVD